MLFYVLLRDRWNLRGPSLELIDGSVAFTGSLGVWDVSMIRPFSCCVSPVLFIRTECGGG